jgi:hypothetical protein
VSPRIILSLGVALMIAAQVVASFVIVPLRPAPTKAQEVFDALTPGEFAGTLMLGGFRGLACDLLWMRADLAKENGRFYESVALFQTISRVQPRFEQAWAYMSWDLAYNLSHEVESDEAKWSWVMAGLRANIEGVGRNPGSEKLLRHLAWMFHHKGDLFHSRIEAARWASELNPVLAAVNAQVDTGREITLFEDQAGYANFDISARLYRAAIALAEANGGNGPPSFVRRLVPLAMESAGNIRRNRGDHLGALSRYLGALRSWQEVKTWADQPGRSDSDQFQRRATNESYERNEGSLRRKAAQLARSLAPTPELGEELVVAIDARRFADSEQMLARPGWRSAIARGGVRWLDER